MRKVTIAVVGATGLVGRTIVKVLEERKFPVGEITFLASGRSAGTSVTFHGEEIAVKELNPKSFEEKYDFVFFAAGGDISREYAHLAAASGARVIDNSSVFRMEEDVPLVVPEVNADAIGNARLIANPNCSTIQCMAALHVLQSRYGLTRVVFSTYQAVSGSGQKGLADLLEDKQEFYPQPIKNNVLPHIDVFLENGYTKEEMKMIHETRKILGDEQLRVTATAVRVPVPYGHSVSINAQLRKPYSMDELIEELADYPGIVVLDDPFSALYPTPMDVEGKDEVYIGRIRRDDSLDSGVNLWVVADNVRKGAATNAVQIAEEILRREA